MNFILAMHTIFHAIEVLHFLINRVLICYMLLVLLQIRFLLRWQKNLGYENVGYTEKDIRNHLNKEYQLALGLGDARAILDNFMQMQDENPNNTCYSISWCF